MPRPDIRRSSRLPVRAALAAATGAALFATACTASSVSSGVPSVGSTTPAARHATSSSSSHAPSPRATRPPGVFTISFAGDVHFSGRVRKRLDRDPGTAFGQAAAGLRTADLTMVNLETAITRGGVPQAKEYHFRAPASAFDALRAAGVDVATMANNHAADYGLPGLHDTLRAIARKHFPTIGIGRDLAAAFTPYKTTLNGVKVAIFAADQVHDETTLSLFSAGHDKPGVANAYYPLLVRDVHRAVRQGYVTIVYLHWGIEYQTCPSSDQTGLAARLAAAGASAVVGTHAHVLQGAGWRHDGTYVAYGLGNYLWWMSFGNNQDDNGVLTLTFHRRTVTGSRFAPSHLDARGVPMPATGATRQRILAEWKADRQCAGLSATPPR